MSSFLISTRRLTLAGGLLLLAAAAHAQPSVELTMDIFTSSVMSQTLTTLNNGIVEEAVKRNNGGKASTKGAVGKSATSATPARLTYTPTAAARSEAVAAHARRTYGGDPERAKQLAATFGPGGAADYSRTYRELTAGAGIPENDVASAYAAYLVGTYRVAHGEAPGAALLPAELVRGVRAQYAPAVSAALEGKSATTTAELGEFLKLQTALLSVGAQGKPETMPAFRQNVATRLNDLFKVDVKALTLTKAGFAKQ